MHPSMHKRMHRYTEGIHSLINDERLRRLAITRAVAEHDAAGLVVLLADLDDATAERLVDSAFDATEELQWQCAPVVVDVAAGRAIARDVLCRVQARAVSAHLSG